MLRLVSGGCCQVLLLLSDGVLQLIKLLSCCDLPCALQHYLKECFSSKRTILKEFHERRASFYGWLPARVFLDVVISWLYLTVTIAISRAWAISMLRQRSWMSHVLIAGTRLSRRCAPDTSSSNLPCPILAPPVLGGLLRLMVRVT